MPVVYIYHPTELICACHNVYFVRFDCKYKDKKQRSYGCPVCVGLIRAKVQMEIHRGYLITKLRKGKISYGKGKRGRPKTKTITTVVEARNGI